MLAKSQKMPVHSFRAAALCALLGLASTLPQGKAQDAPEPQETKENPSTLQRRKSKVVVITSDNGGGHNSAANAVESALGKENYEVVKVDLLKTKLPGDKGFMQKFGQEKWYVLKFLGSLMPVMDYIVRKHHKEFIFRELDKLNPDLLVSVFPIGNSAFQKYARRKGKGKGIPFFMVPTDFRLDIFLRNFDKKKNKKNQVENMVVCLPTIDGKMVDTITEKSLTENAKLTGYPVRPEFAEVAKKFHEKDSAMMTELQKIKDEHNVNKGDRVIYINSLAPVGFKGTSEKILSGFIESVLANGKTLQEFPNQNIHFIVATAKDEALFKLLENKEAELRKDQSYLWLHPKKWLGPSEVGKYMAVSDAIVIKPGGASNGEAVMMQKPILFKADSAKALVWERANLKMVTRAGWGLALADMPKGNVDRSDFAKKLLGAFKLVENENLKPIFMPEFGPAFKKEVEGMLKKFPHHDEALKLATVVEEDEDDEDNEDEDDSAKVVKEKNKVVIPHNDKANKE